MGSAKLKMATELAGPGFAFHYRIRDIRELDGDALLQSPYVGDTVIVVLRRLRDARAAVRQIVSRIADMDPPGRDEAFRQLLILAGLRQLEEYVEEEAKKMPVLNSILDHKVLGREFKRGRAEGLGEGLEKGRQEGELLLLRRLLEKRFGPLPTWAEQNLAKRPERELADLGLRLFDVASLEDLLR